MKKYLECGKIVNTHGLRGEIKAEAWGNPPSWFAGLRRLFVGAPNPGAEFRILSARPQGSCVLLLLDGIGDIDAAAPLRGKILYFDRDDAKLDDGDFYVQDAIGLPVFDISNGEHARIGVLADVLPSPASDVFVVKKPDGAETLIPNAPQFVKSVDLENERIEVELIEGM